MHELFIQCFSRYDLRDATIIGSDALFIGAALIGNIFDDPFII